MEWVHSWPHSGKHCVTAYILAANYSLAVIKKQNVSAQLYHDKEPKHKLINNIGNIMYLVKLWTKNF